MDGTATTTVIPSRSAVPIGFIGAGRVAAALAVALAEQGYPVPAIASRSFASALALAERVPDCRPSVSPRDVVVEAELVFLTVPDDAIASVADELPWRPGQGAVHCSGAAELDVLAAAAGRGAAVGSLHPLQTFARGAETSLRGVTFAVEGDAPLLETLEQIARDLGGQPVRLPASAKARYHAAAVFACNYAVTVVQQAVELWASFGVGREQALPALLPIIRGTVDNLERVGLPEALTGPVARGDVGTIQRHVAALQTDAPGLVELYCHLGLATLPLALAQGGLGPERAQQLRALLTSALETATDARPATTERTSSNTHEPPARSSRGGTCANHGT